MRTRAPGAPGFVPTMTASTPAMPGGRPKRERASLPGPPPGADARPTTAAPPFAAPPGAERIALGGGTPLARPCGMPR